MRLPQYIQKSDDAARSQWEETHGSERMEVRESATYRGLESIVKLLIDGNADVIRVQNNLSGITPLHLVTSRGLERIVQLLIDKDPDIIPVQKRNTAGTRGCR